jgi:hypothetical protein
MVVTFGYGIVRFADGPIHKCVEGRIYLYKQHPDGYCGKQGQSHTAADYASFEKWSDTMFIMWPLGIAALMILLRHHMRRPS